MPHYPVFTNSYHRCLPGYYSELTPTPLKDARLLYHNDALARDLALDSALFTGEETGVWSGERLLPGMQPLAQVYSGHQFGVWAGRLGDGRGILLGEQQLAEGKSVDWHLKGAGLTPYSRMGDGRAVLRSVVREFLASEALHHLGIATTRALTIVTSEEPVWREQPEPGVMMMRIADSHVRFGHFEHFYYLRQQDKVTRLADYVIERHWTSLVGVEGRYRLWLSDVVARTARMIAHWQASGFAHGVMNTDNMSILGLTIDYGPYGFLDAWQPDFICNHSDYQGRYAFDNQPAVALWNLNRLAQSLAGLMPVADLQAALSGYEPALMAAYGERMRAKLGLTRAGEQDNALLTDLLGLMAREGADYSRTFRALSLTERRDPHTPLRDDFIDRAAFDDWFARYRRRLGDETRDDAARRQAMLAVNPRIVLRNYLAQQAIMGAEKGDVRELARLHQALRDPYRDDPDQDDLAAPPPDWGRHLAISCSS